MYHVAQGTPLIRWHSLPVAGRTLFVASLEKHSARRLHQQWAPTARDPGGGSGLQLKGTSVRWRWAWNVEVSVRVLNSAGTTC